MAVKAISVSTTGLVPNTVGFGLGLTQQTPTVIYITTNDTLATVTTSGYLNTVVHDFHVALNNYQMALVYTSDSHDVWLTVSVTGSGAAKTYSLVAISEPGAITTPTVANQIAYATNTLGTIAATGANIGNAGNISAGLSGTAGTLASYPAAASKGALALKAVASTGDTITTISNVAYGQASTVSFADVGSAAGRFLVANTATPFVSGNFPKASGTGGLMVDSGVAVAALATFTGSTVVGNLVKASSVTGQIADQGIAFKSVAGAAAAGGAATQSFTDAFCTTGSCIVGNWNTQTSAGYVIKIVPGNGSFVVTSNTDIGVGTFNYIITK